MEKVELIFIPTPLMGHMGQAIDLANLLLLDDRLGGVSILVMTNPLDPVTTDYNRSISSSTTAITYVNLPPPPPVPAASEWTSKTPGQINDLLIHHSKTFVREFLIRKLRTGGSPALVVDMFCTPFIDVAKEFGLPTYVFFTSNAAFLGLMRHCQILHDHSGVNVPDLANSETELTLPSYANPVPPSVLPFVLVDDKCWLTRFLIYSRKYREAKGIIVNTVAELEPHALGSYDPLTPTVYTVGPLLKPEQQKQEDEEIIKWLDSQPEASVVLLCFGSRGSFHEMQVREIATALERSGYRFLWSLRRPAPVGETNFPGFYQDFAEVLPQGFLSRIAGIGKVVGWVPQSAVLSHPSVGGFVSHCGWNSVLESLWNGVPIATWPLYAEQKLDAFQLVKEMGVGVEISLDYDMVKQSRGQQEQLTAEVIERGIREVMDRGSEVRKRVEEMKEKCRMALKEGGSSHASLKLLVEDMLKTPTL